MTVQYSGNEIRTRLCPDCILCGVKGEPLYQHLKDRLYGVPGQWKLNKCSDPNCGLIWLDPMPLEEDIQRAYANYYTHQDTNQVRHNLLRHFYHFVKKGYWAKRYGYHSTSLAGWVKFLGMLIYLHPLKRTTSDYNIMYLPAIVNGRLLDIGCGSGQRLNLMRDLGWIVEGIDFDRIAVENAKSKGLPVRYGALGAQEYPDNHFDAITMSHLIEHVHDPLKLLRECYRVIKPGGHLVVITPNSESLGHKIFKENWRGLEPPRHLILMSMPSLKRAVELTGFRIRLLRTTLRSSYMLVSSYALGKNMTFQEGKIRLGIFRSHIASFLAFQQCTFSLVKRNWGEEIHLIGKKPPEEN